MFSCAPGLNKCQVSVYFVMQVVVLAAGLAPNDWGLL
jgi:hypothetical protein